MSLTYTRTYCGKVQAVILDWAGTTMDYGCIAPAVVFQDVFSRAKVPITMEEARAPMGAHKKVHIEKLTQLPTVRKRWKEVHGAYPNSTDVEKMFADFIPLQMECLSKYSKLIPGTLEIIPKHKQRNYKIGSPTGFTKEMPELLLRDAKQQGYSPDSTVSASEVPKGRPYPYMLMQNMMNLEVSTVEACVKIDDTCPGVEEGLNAGSWTIALALSGNEVGLCLEDWQRLTHEEQGTYKQKAYNNLRKTGAHYVVDTIQDIMPCLDDIEAKLAKGVRP